MLLRDRRTANSGVKLPFWASLSALLVTLPLLAAPAAAAQAPACPNATLPPPPVDTSEVPPPGSPSPTPLPVPETPVGGDRMGECAVITAEGAPSPPPQVADAAASWVLADLDSGEVLAAKNPHARQRPASTIKTLTALTAIHELDMDDQLVATQQDADQEGTRIGLQPGLTYSVGQVLQAMLMGSGNDAAHALAMKMGGIPQALRKLNATAERIGALDTRAATPSGLDGPGMSTSAYDLAAIFRAAMREPVFAEAVGTEMMMMPGKPGQPPFQLWNDNRVLLNYPGGLGGKTGFTDDARHTFIGSAGREGRRLVAVMVRGENQPVRLSRNAMGLLDYGFALPRDTAAVGDLVTTSPAPSTTVAAPAAQERARSQAAQQPTFYSTIKGPLILLGGALVAMAVVVALWLRRNRLATAARESAGSDEHP
ncbi:D-alanyl-D-alanine carboxypeptidase family protein [Saccharopolyspora griseoalba]|uniref:D-alanyl-D-alanine carboxypeptidase family protein n=1 Tax=Saccharopolyspora griseoalba TaxID=1431848 RepID=A0ABW2LFW6_9PSEU